MPDDANPTPEQRAAAALPCSCTSRYRRDFIVHAQSCPARHIDAAAAAIREAVAAERGRCARVAAWNGVEAQTVMLIQRAGFDPDKPQESENDHE